MSVARIEDAFSLAERGDAAAAADVLQQVLAAAPSYAPAYVLYARVCETLHRWPEALVLWQDAALLVPTLDVAHEGVLRATRVLAALQALDARTAARSERASRETPRPAASAEPLSPPPPAVASEPLIVSTPLQMAPPPPEVERETPAAPPPPRPAPRTETPPIRLGSLPAPPPAESAAPSPSRSPFEPPPPPPVEPPEEHPEPPVKQAGVNPFTRAPLPGGSFDAPPPPPDVFGRTAPPPPAPASASFEADDLDLDSLIEQLNTQGRIRPREDLDRIPAPDLDDDIEDMVSETLARIYATQGQYDEAARIYELLAAQHPAQGAEFMDKAAAMRARAGE